MEYVEHSEVINTASQSAWATVIQILKLAQQRVLFSDCASFNISIQALSFTYIILIYCIVSLHHITYCSFEGRPHISCSCSLK